MPHRHTPAVILLAGVLAAGCGKPENPETPKATTNQPGDAQPGRTSPNRDQPETTKATSPAPDPKAPTPKAPTPPGEEWFLATEGTDQLGPTSNLYTGADIRHSDRLRVTMKADKGEFNYTLTGREGGGKPVTLASKDKVASEALDLPAREGSHVSLHLRPAGDAVTVTYRLETRVADAIRDVEVVDPPQLESDRKGVGQLTFQAVRRDGKHRLTFQVAEPKFYATSQDVFVYRLFGPKGEELGTGRLTHGRLEGGEPARCRIADPALRKTARILIGMPGSGSFEPPPAEPFKPAERVVFQAGRTPGLSDLALTADGKTLFAQGDLYLLRWDLSTGQATRLDFITPTQFGQRRLALTPDGGTLAFVQQRGGGALQVWDLAAKRRLLLVESLPDGNLSVAITPDGKAVAAGFGTPGQAKLWDIPSGAVRATFRGHDFPVYAVALSPSGRTLATGGGDGEDGELKVWQAATGRQLRSFEGHGGPVYAVALSQDGTLMASGAQDNTVCIWEVTTGKRRAVCRHDGPVRCVAFDPNDRAVISAGDDKTVRVWDAASGANLATLKGEVGPVVAMAVARESRTLVAGGHWATVQVFGPVPGAAGNK